MLDNKKLYLLKPGDTLVHRLGSRDMILTKVHEDHLRNSKRHVECVYVDSNGIVHHENFWAHEFKETRPC